MEEEPKGTEEEVTVELEEVPQFIEELSDQEVTEGDTVTLYVKVKGTPFPELTWLVVFPNSVRDVLFTLAK